MRNIASRRVHNAAVPQSIAGDAGTPRSERRVKASVAQNGTDGAAELGVGHDGYDGLRLSMADALQDILRSEK